MSGSSSAHPPLSPQARPHAEAVHRAPPPGHVVVVCPAGFNATSTKNVDPKKAVYARVTYRPH